MESSEKPGKGELSLWFQSKCGKYFLSELAQNFKIISPQYRFQTLEDQAENAGRAQVLDWIYRLHERS